MIILRLILIFLVGLALRRLFYLVFPSGKKARRPSSSSASAPDGGVDEKLPLEKLTQQDISDADFEEIP